MAICQLAAAAAASIGMCVVVCSVSMARVCGGMCVTVDCAGCAVRVPVRSCLSGSRLGVEQCSCSTGLVVLELCAECGVACSRDDVCTTVDRVMRVLVCLYFNSSCKEQRYCSPRLVFAVGYSTTHNPEWRLIQWS